MSTSTQAGRRGARLANDPDKYLRRVKGGRWQARPFVPLSEGGEGRVNLGCFDTAAEARQAVRDFWWGRRAAKLKWARPVPRGDGTVWIAVVRLPEWARTAVRQARGPDGRWARGLAAVPIPPSHRLPGEYATPEEAHRAARRWLADRFGLTGVLIADAPAADLCDRRAA